MTATTPTVIYRYSDPLSLAHPYSLNAEEGSEQWQRIADRLWLLVRQYRYPVFDHPMMPLDEVLVTRFDPSDMRPIEPVRDNDDIARAARSEFLRPCIYVNGPDLIRKLVAEGNPPILITRDTLGDLG